MVQAADSVTLYGLIDAGIGYEQVKFNGDKQSRLGAVQGVSSGSRFGLRGVEDLGDGLRAVFNLETGFGPLNGTIRSRMVACSADRPRSAWTATARAA